MGRPLRAVYANTTYSNGVQEMSNSDILDVAGALVLNYVTANRPLYTVLGINDSNTSAVSIGSVIDTNKGPVGAAPTNFSNTIVFSVRAGTNSIPSGLTRPVQYTVVGDEVKIQEMSDSDLLTYFYAPIVDYMSTGGQGAYYLGLTSSGPPGTGTWTSAGTLNDTYYVSTTLTSDNYTLWQRTDAATTGTVRPLKQTVSGTTTKLVEMSDSEMQALGAYIGEYNRQTGIGQYAVQASAPGTGTWVDRGLFTNSENTTADNGSYIGGYTGTFSAGYTGAYTSAYTGIYAGTYNQTFQGTFSISFTGAYTGAFSSAYTGAYSKGFTSPLSTGFTGTYAGTYAGTFALRQGPSYQTATPTTFTGVYQGNVYTASFVGYYNSTTSYTATFAGTITNSFSGRFGLSQGFTSGPASPSNPGSFTGLYNGPAIPHSYQSIGYTGVRPEAYTGTAGFAGNYVGPAPSYTGTYGSPTTFTGSYTATDPYSGRDLSPNPYAGYFATFVGNYAGTVFYAGTYAAGPVTYTGVYVGAQNYTGPGTTPVTFQLITNWTGTYTPSYAGTYTNNTYLNPLYFTSYTSTAPGSFSGLSYTPTFAGTYNGSSYTRTWTGEYNGIALGPLYTKTYSGLPTYAGSRDKSYTGTYNRTYTGAFTGIYAATYSQAFTGVYSKSYTGTFTLSFTGNYAGTYSRAYAGTYGSFYTGLVYTGVYTGLAVQSATTTNIYKLWVRTA